jgi:hypothetical protein
MEPITNLPPQWTPADSSPVANKALSALEVEAALLKETAQEAALTQPNLGRKIDIKV